MRKILLDTNFLLVPMQFKIDIYDKLHGELCTLDSCIQELKKMSEKKTESGLQARAALLMAKMKKVKIIEAGEKEVDIALEKAAKEHKYIVATNDRELIKSLKESGIKIIRLRQKKLLVEE